jgi:Cu/Zn superoxide dismutase
MKSIVRGIAAFIVMGLAAGCSSTKQPAYEPSIGLEARMTGVGSSASGFFRVYDARDGSGVNVQLTLLNALPGTYRITLHERGNCKSQNLFSAGPAWAPAGSGRTPGDLLPVYSTDTEGDIHNYGAFLRGVHVDGPQGLVGKVVVVQYGHGVSNAEPGLPNKRMACGVLEYAKPIF